MITIPKSALSIYPLCLGGNVFGWSADKKQSEEVLDYFLDNGGNFIDTSDMYSQWGEGHSGGESETIIGDWLTRRGNRSKVIIATKVGKMNTRLGLSAANIKAACDESLARLKSDYIDLYYAHQDDLETPIEETLGAFDSLVKAGKVRYIAASNFTSERLAQSIETSKRLSLASYIASQDNYNLLERGFEQSIRPTLTEYEIAEIPYFGLARGFLTGKYRPGKVIESVRAGGVAGYQNERGWSLLTKLDELAASHATTVSAIALAWLRAQPTVAAPIASARTVAQLQEFMPLVELSESELQALRM